LFTQNHGNTEHDDGWDCDPSSTVNPLESFTGYSNQMQSEGRLKKWQADSAWNSTFVLIEPLLFSTSDPRELGSYFCL
jgi:hypothetical protein